MGFLTRLLQMRQTLENAFHAVTRWFAKEPTVEGFAKTLIERARQAGANHWRYDAHEQALIDERNPGHRLNLGNIFLEYRRASRSHRPHVLQKDVALLTGTPAVPGLWSLAAKGIYAVLRSRYLSALTEINSRDSTMRFVPIMRPFVADLVMAVVYDCGEQMAYATQANLETWGAPEKEVWSRAIGNLRALPKPHWERLSGGVYRLASSVTYEESFLLSNKAVDALGISQGVFALPNRGVLLAADSTDPKAVAALTAEMRRSLGEAPWPLSATLLTRSAEGWGVFQAPPELAASVRELDLLNLAKAYQSQKNALEKLHARTQTDIFVATFTVVAPKDNPSALTSYATWSQGVDSLLPKADLIMFYRHPVGTDPELIACPWDTAERIFGHHLEPTAEDPIRYRVRSFPSDQEFEQLKRALA